MLLDFEKIDLIDTLWNVKDLLHKQRNRDVGGFNRYIVECKVLFF